MARKLPDSKELWDDTNLPMCIVVTPAAESVSSSASSALTLASLPKCLHCGAPHASEQTHFRPLHGSVLLCYLCGKVSSTTFDDQQDAREQEDLDASTFDTRPASSDGEVIVDLPLYPGLFDRLPAKACPPVWWIVLDASQSARSYWRTVASLLESVDIPDHVHVGIVAAGTMQLSAWDLTSDVPHVWHTPFSHPQISLTLVPADAMHSSNIQAALRAIADAQPGTVGAASKDDSGMALGLAIEVILEFMETATHPGQDIEIDENIDVNALRYAGGRILCLLGNPPLDIDFKIIESQPPYGPGGVAGACSDPLTNKWEETDEHPEKEPTDWTPTNLKESVEPMEPEDVFQTLGTRCANAALGVDLFILVPEEIEPQDDDYAVEIRPFYGLPLLHVLATTSGAPGPLLFGTKNEDSLKALKKELHARTPWQPGTIFGATLRSRISPGFDLEDSPIDPVGRDKLQQAPFMSTGGLSGPAVMTDKGLWVLGSCDPYTSVIIDYQILGQPDMLVIADGMGKVALKPVVQFCVAYTCVEHEALTGDYFAVRKLKISSMPLPLVSSSELLYDSMDPEALAVVLYQKLFLNAVQDGLVDAQQTAESWLTSLLVCVYQSAQVEQATIEGLLDNSGGNDQLLDSAETEEETSQFVASGRLLDIGGGDLSEEQILLGLGHAKIAVMPLILYSLMQCDALRPTMGSFGPSMDSRSAALTQMASMTPTTLSKCIAPSLQLWSTQIDEVLMESIDLKQSAIQKALQECNAPDAVFFLDSPQQILVYRADQGRVSSTQSTASLILGPRLKSAIEAAATAYRTRPPIRYELKGKPFSKEATTAFENLLIEDCPLYEGIQDFDEWKVEIVKLVHE